MALFPSFDWLSEMNCGWRASVEAYAKEHLYGRENVSYGLSLVYNVGGSQCPRVLCAYAYSRKNRI